MKDTLASEAGIMVGDMLETLGGASFLGDRRMCTIIKHFQMYMYMNRHMLINITLLIDDIHAGDSRRRLLPRRSPLKSLFGDLITILPNILLKHTLVFNRIDFHPFGNIDIF